MKALGLPCDSLLADSLSLSTKIELMEGHLFYHVARSSSAPTADAQEAASAPSPAPKAAVVEAEGVVDVAVDESDLMIWTVQMAMPRDSPLGADLASYAAAVKGGGGSRQGASSVPPFVPSARKMCLICEKPSTTRCSKCKAVMYCSVECQKLGARTPHRRTST